MLALYLRLESSWVSLFVITIAGVVKKKKTYVRETTVAVTCGVPGTRRGIDKAGHVVLLLAFGPPISLA